MLIQNFNFDLTLCEGHWKRIHKHVSLTKNNFDSLKFEEFYQFDSVF